MSIFYPRAHWCRTLLGIALLILGLALCSQAQVYYTTSDNNAGANSATDALNRMNYDGTSMTPIVQSIATIPNLMALDVPGNRAFVYEGLTASRSIKVFSNVSGSPTLVRTLSIAPVVTAIEYDANSDYLYVLTSDNNTGSNSTSDALNRIKADGTGVLEPLVQNIATIPALLTLNATGTRAYVYEGLTASRGIKTIDLTNNTITGSLIGVGAAVTALDYARADGNLYYLTTDGTNSSTSVADALYKVPVSGGSTTTIISSLTNFPAYMALDLANDRIYVADNFASTPRRFLVVRPSTGTVTATYAQSTLLTAVEIGQQAPPTTVNAIVRASATPTNASTINYTVTFGAPVSGLTAANFSLTTTGSVNGVSVSTPVSSAGNTWTVPVNTGTGSGTLTLNLANDTGLSFDITTTLPFAGETYTIDRTAPAAPVVVTPANGSTISTTIPSYVGTAEANSTVTVIVDGNSIGTTAANGSGSWTTTQSTTLAQGSHTVRTTTTDAAGNRSPSSNTNTFTVDITRPSVTISSMAGDNNSTSGTTPVPFTITFSESVTNFVQGGLSVTGGTVSGFTGSGSTYTFNVTPISNGATVTVNVAANTAQDQAGNGNTAATPFSINFQAPTITVAPASLPNGTQGTAYNQTLSASGGTAPYAYAITAGALPAGLSLSTVGTLSGTPTANGTFNFTVTATDNSTTPGPYGGARAYTLTIAVPAVTWMGTVSTDWFNPNNWTPNQVPDATLNVTIPTSPSGDRFPIIISGIASTRNLTVNSGATLTQFSGTLIVYANLTNNGTFLPTGGTVVLGITALSNLYGSSNTRFWNLTVGTNGAQQSTSASTSVQRTLALNGGNFATNGNPFTLESNATNTAMVVNNGGVVNGNVTVQRYIDPSNPGPGYRHYSSPVQTTTIADLTTSSFTPVVNGNYTSATAPRRVQPYPTVYYYDQSRLATANASYAVGDFDNGFLSPSALSSPLAPGSGYAVNVSSANLVDFVGQLNNGTIAKSQLVRGAQSNAGWQLLGNPYPSPIDWNQLYATSTGIEGGFYVFKSNSQYTGAYAAYLTNGQSVNGGTGTIPSMQGFFVRVAAGQTGSVTFTNQCRRISYDNPAFARQAADTRPTVRLELMTAQGEKDEALVYFEPGATSGVDTRYDAVKLANSTRLNLCSRVGSDFLAINGLPSLSKLPLTVPLSVQVPSTGRYTLLASQLANVAGNRVVLHDRQTGTRTDLTDPAGYVVELTEGQHGDRFALLFNPATEPKLDKKGQLVPAKRH